MALWNYDIYYDNLEFLGNIFLADDPHGILKNKDPNHAQYRSLLDKPPPPDAWGIRKYPIGCKFIYSSWKYEWVANLAHGIP